jgi:transposase-like protein
MGRHFKQQIIMRCARKYLRYKLSFRDLVEIMSAENTIRVIPNRHFYTNNVLKSELLQMKQATSLHVQPTIHM